MKRIKEFSRRLREAKERGVLLRARYSWTLYCPEEAIPEFPTWTSMLLILIVLSVAIAIYKRRLLKTPIH